MTNVVECKPVCWASGTAFPGFQHCDSWEVQHEIRTWLPESGFSSLSAAWGAGTGSGHRPLRGRSSGAPPGQNLLVSRLHLSQDVHPLGDGTLQGSRGRDGGGLETAGRQRQPWRRRCLPVPTCWRVGCSVHWRLNVAVVRLGPATGRSKSQGCSHCATDSSMWQPTLLLRGPPQRRRPHPC